MADSATHWCTLCLAEREIQTPVQVDWPRIPICSECAAATAVRISGGSTSDIPQPTVPNTCHLLN